MQTSAHMTRETREAYRSGRECYERGDIDGALTRFTRLLDAHPRFADIHYMVGLVHERKGDLEAAAQSLERALHINPGYAEAMIALVSIYERLGQYESSRALAERMGARGAPGVLDATTRGKLANLQATLGDAYREAGDLREAIEAYRKALDRCPAFHDIRHRMGVALRELGLPSRAIAEFKRVLRSNPGYLDSAIQLGLTLYTLGRTEQALEAWEQVLERDPEREDARMYLRMVRSSREPRESRAPKPASESATLGIEDLELD
jgi:tetratricopeptide (TPR) repeat protein